MLRDGWSNTVRHQLQSLHRSQMCRLSDISWWMKALKKLAQRMQTVTNWPFNLLAELRALAHKCTALPRLMLQHFHPHGCPSLKTDPQRKPRARLHRLAARMAAGLVALSALGVVALPMPSFDTL